MTDFSDPERKLLWVRPLRKKERRRRRRKQDE
jgi:hypothetical protein